MLKWRTRYKSPHCKVSTPLKVPLTRRRHGRGRLPCEKYEAIPEHEAEDNTVAESSHFRPNSRPSQCKSQVQPSSATGVWSKSPSSSAKMTLDHPGRQVRPIPLEAGLTVKPSENLSDSSDHDETCDSSTSSSLPSSEIFRHNADFSSEDASDTPVAVRQHQVKNSTLLGDSHAESINRHQPPNVSTVLCAPSILVNTTNQISDHGATADQTHSVIRSGDESLKGKSLKPLFVTMATNGRVTGITLVKPAVARRSITYRKILRSKTPPDAEQNSKDVKVTFFHFDFSLSRKEFFQQARERHARLTGGCPFRLVTPKIP
ncbi:uncharacterized protein LOC144006358 isoform X2 [Festucalex cinctus]